MRAQPPPVLGTRARAVFSQQLYALVLSIHACKMHWRVTVGVLKLAVHAGEQQGVHRVFQPPHRCDVQRRVAVVVLRVSVHLLVVEQEG